MNIQEYAQGIIETTDKSIIGYELKLRFDIIDFINKKLKEKGISKKELALKIGIKPSQLSRILRAEANITLRTVARIFHAFESKAEISEEKPFIIGLVGIGDSIISNNHIVKPPPYNHKIGSTLSKEKLFITTLL